MKVEEKMAKKALAAWNARRKAVTERDVRAARSRPRDTELLREVDVMDAAMPPSLPKRRKRRRRWTTQSLLSCSS